VSAFSIAGLSSGIDTTSLISQLMTVAAQPQTALKNQLATQQSLITTYQSLNTKLQALQTAADAVSSSDNWAAAAASSSSTSVIASTTTGAIAGSSATFNVTQLATSQISTVAVGAGGTVVSTPSNGIDITDSAGTAHHISLTDGSAAGVVSAINSAGVGVRAALVNTSSGQIMQLTGTSTGAANSFSISGTDSAAQTLATAQDAQITIGNPAAGGYTMTSSTNTFSGVLPGVTFTVGGVASNVTVSVSSDSTTISNNVKAMVDAANSVLSELSTDTGKGGPLETNYQINAITQSVLNLVSHGDANGNSFAGLGIQLTSTGSLKFDATAFTAAYNADPAGTQKTISALATATSSASSAASINTVSPLITSGNSQVSNLTKQISDWDTRLTNQQTALQAKYTAMEVALQKIKSTSSWLTSALNSLSGQTSTSSSSSSTTLG